MDLFARALIAANQIVHDSEYLELKNGRYQSFNSGKGKEFEEDKLTLEELYQHASTHYKKLIMNRH